MDDSKYTDIPHFSKAVLFISLLFLAINVAWFGVLFRDRQADRTYGMVAPRVVFARNQDVTVKTLFDEAFAPAIEAQVIRVGTKVKTGAESFAELQLEGNLIRLDQNTTVELLENQFSHRFLSDPALPRLSLALLSGSVWVNAREPVQIKMPKSAATFTHAVGSATYAGSMNRVMVVRGGADLALFNQGVPVALFFIPFRHQVTFADSQITDRYAQLQSSKLKKELKLGLLPESVLADQWVERNLAGDGRAFALPKRVQTRAVYKFQDRYYRLRQKLAWLMSTRHQMTLARFQNQLDFLLGGVQNNGDSAEAKRLLAEMAQWTLPLQGDSFLSELFSREFYRIPSAPFDSPAFLTKDHLRQALLDEKGPALLRTQLLDLEQGMVSADLSDLIRISESWLSQWDSDALGRHYAEFEKQYQLYAAMLLSHPDRLSLEFLTFLDQMDERRLAHTANPEEVLFTMAEDRLELASSLTMVYRYSLAKQVLTAASEVLKADVPINQSAKDILDQRVELLAERIEFARSELHGAAAPIDETEFREYIRRKARDETLSETLRSFLQTEEPDAIKEPALPEVMRQFAEARITLTTEDITRHPDNPFAFSIRNAQLLDRSKDGSLVRFSAEYDYLTDGVHDISVGTKILRGNFALSDLAVILTERPPGTVSGALPVTETFTADWVEGTDDESRRAQVLAQDLAVQLVLEELRRFDIQIGNTEAVAVLNPSTLDQFKITEAGIPPLAELRKKIEVTFEFQLSSKQITGARTMDGSVTFPARIPLADFVDTVHRTLSGRQERQQLLRAVWEELAEKGFTVNQEDLTLEADGLIHFRRLGLATLPAKISGTFNLRRDGFLEATHELLSHAEVTIEDYFNELGPLFIVDYLEGKGITVNSDQLFTVFPFQVIAVRDFGAGDSVLDFEVDLQSNQLKNVSIQGNSSMISTMSFEEFRNILKGFQE